VHPQVQEAAGVLIYVLIAKSDLFNAERYAQVTCSNLRDKKNVIDQESEVVAMGAYNLANVIFKQKGDLIKAEEIARESLRIRTPIHDGNYSTVVLSCNLLDCNLSAQGKSGDETRGLYERSLAICIRDKGPDGENVATVNGHIGGFYYKLAKNQSIVDAMRTHLLLAKSHFVEAQRISSKTNFESIGMGRAILHGPTHPNTVDDSFRLTIILSILSQL
jgi:hypothetical protein